MTELLEKRVIQEQGLASKIGQLIEGALIDLGFRLVRVRMLPSTLQIMAERPDGRLKIEECELISKTISPILDAEDPISHAYRLEVSSPGIDRPLVRKSDFVIWSGHDLKVELEGSLEGRRRFRGLIKDVRDEGITIAEMSSKNEEKLHEVPFSEMSEARLVMNDALIAAALKGKTAEEYNKELIGDQPLQFAEDANQTH